MTVLIAYAATPEGAAALEHGLRIAEREGTDAIAFDLDGASGAHDRSIEPSAQTPAPIRWFARAKDSRSAPDDLVDLADRLAVDVIVVGVRRRSPIGKFVLGSNAQHILIDAHVPVLAVKAQR